MSMNYLSNNNCRVARDKSQSEYYFKCKEATKTYIDSAEEKLGAGTHSSIYWS